MAVKHVHCWYTHAIDILRRASLSADETTREVFELMTDGEVAKFCFSDVPWNTAFEFGKSLLEHDVLRLPYPRCYFQYGNVTSHGLMVAEFATDDGLLWYIWRAMREPGSPDGFGLMTIANMTLAGSGSGGYVRNTRAFSGADSHMLHTAAMMHDSNMSNIDEAVCCTAYLGFKGVETELVNPKKSINERRAREGRRLIEPYHIVNVRAYQQRESINRGTHASPAPHWRRGHVRILPSGVATVVKPHPVMGGTATLPQYKV